MGLLRTDVRTTRGTGARGDVTSARFAVFWGHTFLLELFCPCLQRATGKNCEYTLLCLSDSRYNWVSLSYLSLPCCSADLPGELQSAPSSLLQFKQAIVIDALAPTVSPVLLCRDCSTSHP